MAILGYPNRQISARSYGIDEWLSTRGIDGWLDIATDDLAPSARAQIVKEISSHYAEAVAEHIAAGDPEPLAKTSALAELGDPTRAAWDFQKTYLTAKEAEWINLMECTATEPFFSFRSLNSAVLDLIPLTMGLLFLLWRQVPGCVFTVLIFSTFVVIGFRLITRMLWLKQMPRHVFIRVVVISTFSACVPAMVTFFIIFPCHDLSDIFFYAIMFFHFGFSRNPGFQIWRKIKNSEFKAAKGAKP